MPLFVEYELDDETTILVEATTKPIDDYVGASKREGPIVKAKMKFREALKEAKIQAKILLEEIEELHVEEAEIKFGLTTMGEVGNLAVGKVGVDVNYEVTLKWKKTESK